MNQNSIKKYSSLAAAKYRNKYGLFLAEGLHLVEELLKSDWEIETIVSSKRGIEKHLNATASNIAVELVDQSVIDKIATTKTPQDILAVGKIPDMTSTKMAEFDKLVIADGIKDPGNMGTIIRTAKAFDFDLLIATSDSVDIFNPKVVRATQGAMFGIPMLINTKSEIIINALKPTHKLYALVRDGAVDLENSPRNKKSALIIGTEIEGVSKPFLDNSDYLVRIPHSESVESLNAAVAAGIAMYHFSRQDRPQ